MVCRRVVNLGVGSPWLSIAFLTAVAISGLTIHERRVKRAYEIQLLEGIKMEKVRAANELNAYATRQMEMKMNMEKMRSAYTSHALRIQAERIRNFQALPFSDREGSCDLLILVTTANRAKLGPGNGYKYLDETLQSFIDDANKQKRSSQSRYSLSKLCILVVNNSPGQTPSYDRIRSTYLGLNQVHDEEHRNQNLPEICFRSKQGNRGLNGTALSADHVCRQWVSPVSGDCGVGPEFTIDCRSTGTDAKPEIRFVEQITMNDPWPVEFIKATADKSVITIRNIRLQGIHLSQAMLDAFRWHSKYVMIVEDDMPFCLKGNETALSHINNAISLADATSKNTSSDWSMLRVGYGGNGVIIHCNDLPRLGDYILSNLGQMPVDWAMPQWGGSVTPIAAQENSHRRLYTYRWNLFRHIGALSNFDRTWNVDAVDNGKASNGYMLPACFKLNTFMRPEEQFMTHSCHGMISPCFCPATNNFCGSDTNATAHVTT